MTQDQATVKAPTTVRPPIVAPIGWWLALLVWAYTIISFFVANAVKIATYRLLGHLVPSHARHLARIEGHVAA